MRHAPELDGVLEDDDRVLRHELSVGLKLQFKFKLAWWSIDVFGGSGINFGLKLGLWTVDVGWCLLGVVEVDARLMLRKVVVCCGCCP